jgi:hypothetical protein
MSLRRPSGGACSQPKQPLKTTGTRFFRAPGPWKFQLYCDIVVSQSLPAPNREFVAPGAYDFLIASNRPGTRKRGGPRLGATVRLTAGMAPASRSNQVDCRPAPGRLNVRQAKAATSGVL